METLFLHLVNMSITAGWIALAVIILRLFLKKAPKWITVLLWGLVGLRLILPVSIESVLSLIPSAETIPPEIVYSDAPQIHSGIDTFNQAVNPVISDSLAPEVGASVNPVQVLLFIATVVWILGMVGMMIYTLISYLRLRSKVKVSMSIEKNTYICDDINTPFILGIIKPKIYLPSNLTNAEQEYVLRHEKAHIKRKDHLIKPLGFLLLSVYWFNPLLWVAYILLCRDIELACDEKVIRDMDVTNRKEYSTALLNCSVPRRMISACPLAFGEVSVKQRIKSVLNYKKPAFWISIVAIVLCIALSVGFLTNPIDNNPYGVKVVDSGSDIEGVSLELTKLEIAEDLESNPYIEAKWKNKNNESYTCGEEFYIYKYVDGEWVNIRQGDYAYVTIGYMIPKNGTFKHKYGLWNIEIDEVGTYRFESTYLRDKGDTFPTQYKAWIDFEVTKIPDFDENGYKVTNSNSDREGIYAKIVDLNVTASKPYIEVMWCNDNDYDITCGEYFYIYKFTKGEWIDCRSEDAGFFDISFIVPANGTFTHKYSLYNIDINTAGTYRFESPFSSKGEKVRIDFQYPVVSTSDITTTKSGSQPGGIMGEVLSIIREDNFDMNAGTSERSLSVMWYNKAEKNISTVVEKFTLYKKVNNAWIDQREYPAYYPNASEVTIEGASMQIDYPLDSIANLTSGQYKLEVDFYSKPETTDTHYTAYIEFTVDSSTLSSNYETFEADDVAHYYFNESEEVLKPQVTLYRRTREFRFTLSGLSSYVPTGKYSTEENILTLTADDGNKYVFEVIDSERLKFIADKSAEIPKYRYSANEVARHPFNDGDIFRTKSDSTTVHGNDLYTTLHYETADFDIDGDGSIEEVSITNSDTSGIFSFRIIAKENGKVKYNSRFTGNQLDFTFEQDENGKVYVLGTREGYTSEDGRTLLQAESHKYDIRVINGLITLSENGLPYGYEMLNGDSEEIAELIRGYIKAYKTHDVELLNSCFTEDKRISPTDTKAIDTFINCVEDCRLDYVQFKEVSDYKVTATVIYEMIYTEDYLPVGDRQTGYNLITCDFTFEDIDGKFLITGMSMETVAHNQQQYFANHTTQKVPYTYDEIIKKIIDAFPWKRDGASALFPDLPNSSYMYRRHSKLSEIGYALIDLDNNGQQELIISSIDSTFVYDLYTISDGNTVHLFSSGERYAHTLYNNGYIELGWSSGAACSGHDFYRLTNGKLEFLQRITLDAFYAEEVGIIDELTDAGNDNTFFRSKSENEKDYVHISDAEALDLIDSYKNSAEELKIEYTPLSEYNN